MHLLLLRSDSNRRTEAVRIFTAPRLTTSRGEAAPCRAAPRGADELRARPKGFITKREWEVWRPVAAGGRLFFFFSGRAFGFLPQKSFGSVLLALLKVHILLCAESMA